jgi:quercetin dioxygenase-like cupin family protein
MTFHRFVPIAIAFSSSLMLGELNAQTGAPLSPTRTLLASSSLPTAVDVPRYYALFRLNIAANQQTTIPGNGFLYVLSGNLTVASSGKNTTLKEGEAIAIHNGGNVEVTADRTSSVALHFVLGGANEISRSPGSSSVTEVYRTPAAIPGLKPGLYEFTLARVTFPARAPANPPHHRSGAAIYYVLSGTGSFISDGIAEPRPPGSIQYEPNDLVHQWANASDSPLVFIQANISQEGVPAVIFK